MKFVFFPVSENGENGLGDEEAYGGNALPSRIFGLEPPLSIESWNCYFYFKNFRCCFELDTGEHLRR